MIVNHGVDVVPSTDQFRELIFGLVPTLSTWTCRISCIFQREWGFESEKDGFWRVEWDWVVKRENGRLVTGDTLKGKRKWVEGRKRPCA